MQDARAPDCLCSAALHGCRSRLPSFILAGGLSGDEDVLNVRSTTQQQQNLMFGILL